MICEKEVSLEVTLPNTNMWKEVTMGNTRHRMEHDETLAFSDCSKLLYVTTSKYEGDWQSILHSHPFSELFYVVDGCGTFVAEGTEFPVGKNDMVIINPHVQHTEKSLHTTPLDYIVLGIDGLSFSFEDITSAQNGLSMQTASGAVYKYNMQSSNVYAYLNIMLEEISSKKKIMRRSAKICWKSCWSVCFETTTFPSSRRTAIC